MGSTRFIGKWLEISNHLLGSEIFDQCPRHAIRILFLLLHSFTYLMSVIPANISLVCIAECLQTNILRYFTSWH